MSRRTRDFAARIAHIRGAKVVPRWATELFADLECLAVSPFCVVALTCVASPIADILCPLAAPFMGSAASVILDAICLAIFPISMVASRSAIYLRPAIAEAVIGHRGKRRTSKTSMFTFHRTLASQREMAIEP